VLWILAGASLLILLGLVVFSKKSATKDIDYRRDQQGNVQLLDTPRMRADAAFAYDRNIEMEKRGHVLSNGMSWNERWLNTIRSVRSNTENPEWYVGYIIEQRRKAGLPELEGVEDAGP